MKDELRPDAGAQFRDQTEPFVYMGGTAMSCGMHPTLPKRHRWGPWSEFVMPNPEYLGRERMCKVCGLMSDVETKAIDGKGFGHEG